VFRQQNCRAVSTVGVCAKLASLEQKSLQDCVFSLRVTLVGQSVGENLYCYEFLLIGSTCLKEMRCDGINSIHLTD
jgi:hypothetical protein